MSDLLPDHSSESFEAWLKQEPSTCVISRDRGGIHSEGAQLRTPAEKQVSDRFHLFCNLSAAVQRALEERSRQMHLAVPEPPQAEAARSLEVQKTRQQAYGACSSLLRFYSFHLR